MTSAGEFEVHCEATMEICKWRLAQLC